ncbi:zinc finger CCHC domain-containing protein 14 [Protopterus annectens]|uniref:zinc finger CCHC domain-containing protein 14 n=1 Tax=Protopterus annectens TaxID=7888 RepID=UPI001CFBB95F|nr:zinc finger CCHC domain-containing protein 14 [Protopterus annectens]
MVEKRSFLQQDAVYAWFSDLSSSQRVEFLCGLLDLCIPLELRFIGTCLEDLARKDYNSLRDSEIKANNPADLSSLTNITDEVVRSKLLVTLALLTSNNREAARVLYRTLTHIDSVINNYGLQLDGRTGDEFLLLFTMASNHPAFTFHQKQVLRQELAHIQGLLNSTSNTNNVTLATCTAPVTTVSTKNNSICCSPVVSCQGCHMVSQRVEAVNGSVSGNGLESAVHTSAHSFEELSPKRFPGKHSRVVNVERVELKRVSKDEKAVECLLEIFWSDSSVSSVTKSLQELTDFLVKLSKVFPEDAEKFIPHLAGANSSFLQERNIDDLEMDLRSLASLPSHILKSDHIKKFFSQPLKHLNSSSPCLHKTNVITAATVRPICIQSTQSSNIQLAVSSPSAQCPGSFPVSTSISLSCRARGEMASFPSASISIPVSSCSQTIQNQEQTGILDWLRKLRLHKYYPVFQQLSMEKFLSLTEEDLDKFESLTTGAKKKLKTQLELEK